MIATAQAEGNKQAENSFSNAMAVEKIHYDLYSKALEAIKSGSDLPQKAMYVCPVCGNTVEGEAPETCPICSVPGSKFIAIA